MISESNSNAPEGTLWNMLSDSIESKDDAEDADDFTLVSGDATHKVEWYQDAIVAMIEYKLNREETKPKKGIEFIFFLLILF